METWNLYFHKPHRWLWCRRSGDWSLRNAALFCLLLVTDKSVSLALASFLSSTFYIQLSIGHIFIWESQTFHLNEIKHTWEDFYLLSTHLRHIGGLHSWPSFLLIMAIWLIYLQCNVNRSSTSTCILPHTFIHLFPSCRMSPGMEWQQAWLLGDCMESLTLECWP